jgi:hypothetical protein
MASRRGRENCEGTPRRDGPKAAAREKAPDGGVTFTVNPDAPPGRLLEALADLLIDLVEGEGTAAPRP